MKLLLRLYVKRAVKRGNCRLKVTLNSDSSKAVVHFFGRWLVYMDENRVYRLDKVKPTV